MDRLTGFRRAEVAIVGSSLTALLLASALSHAGMQVILLQHNSALFPSEPSLGTVLCAPAYRRIKSVWGTEQALSHASSLMAQLHSLQSSSLPYVLDTAAYVYARTRMELPMLDSWQELFHRLHLPVHPAPDAGGCPFPVEASLLITGQIQTNTAQWINALQSAIRHQGGLIFTDSPVIEMDSTRLRTDHGCVEAPLIVHASDMPSGLHSVRLLSLLESRRWIHCRMTGTLPLHSCQIPVQADELVLQPIQGGIIASLDAGRVGTQHMHRRLALFGKLLSQHLPDWRTQEISFTRCVQSADGLPLIGPLPGTRHLCASAWGEYGVLGAMHAASVLTRRILGQATPEDYIYAPNREPPKRLMHRQKRQLMTRFALNALRRSAPSCAHCRCRIRYCTHTQRWECPLCGTSYTMLGQIIESPGMKRANLSIRQRPDI